MRGRGGSLAWLGFFSALVLNVRTAAPLKGFKKKRGRICALPTDRIFCKKGEGDRRRG